MKHLWDSPLNKWLTDRNLWIKILGTIECMIPQYASVCIASLWIQIFPKCETSEGKGNYSHMYTHILYIYCMSTLHVWFFPDEFQKSKVDWRQVRCFITLRIIPARGACTISDMYSVNMYVRGWCEDSPS